jgi:hypothetical protein
MRRLILVLAILFGFLLHGSAQEADEVVASEDEEEIADIIGDTSIYINELTFSPDSIAKWKQDRDLKKVTELERLLRKEQADAMSNMRKEKDQHVSVLGQLFSASLFRIILWLLAFFFVGYLLYRLLLSKGIFVKNSTATSVTKTDDLFQETRPEDHRKLLTEAEKAGDYRMAIRYHYLISLHKMAAKNLVQLSAEKTNHQYLQELPANRKIDFSRLLRIYEYCWFGRVAISTDQYQEISNEFTQFQKK